MKNIFLLVLGTALFFVSLITQAASLSLVPSLSNVPVGSSFSLELIFDGLGNHTTPSVGAFDVDLNYDSNKVNLMDISFGSSLGDDSLGEAITGTNIATSGSVNVYEYSLLESSSTHCNFCIDSYLEDLQGSSLNVATFSFQTIQAGVAAFTVTINSIADGNGDSLSTTINPLPTIQITAVPIPATLWLFASSLSLLGLFHRRQSI